MLTNPSTLGVFERRIAEIAEIVHEAGGLLYYDGANLNLILSAKTRPGDMGFDVMHLDSAQDLRHPTWRRRVGAGQVAANARLAPFLPVPIVGQTGDRYHWLTETDRPQSIGKCDVYGECRCTAAGLRLRPAAGPRRNEPGG